MSKRTALILTLAAVIGITALMLALKKTTLSQGISSESASPREPESSAISKSNTTNLSELQSSETAAEYKARMMASVEESIAKHPYPDYARYYLENSRDPTFDFRQSVDFYGKVIDERGEPVEGATVNFRWRDGSEEGHAKATNFSDANGLFSLQGKYGLAVSVSVTKDGYYVPPVGAMRSFEYANPFMPSFHRPDPLNPVVFRLRKRGQATNLLTSKKGVYEGFSPQVPPDGTPVSVDVLNRKFGSEGQLQVSQVKPPYPQWKDATSWSLGMRIPDGGFIEHNDEFPFEAPESGYQPVVEFNFQKGTTNWTERLNKQYYIRFGNPPRYGRLHVETSLSSTNVRLTYVINPSGSRNLEHDPNAAPKPAFYE